MLSRCFFLFGAIIVTGIFAAAVPKNALQFSAVVIDTAFCSGGVAHDVVATVAAAPSSSFAAAVALGAGVDSALSGARATLGGGGILRLEGIFRLRCRDAGVFFRSSALSSP